MPISPVKNGASVNTMTAKAGVRRAATSPAEAGPQADDPKALEAMAAGRKGARRKDQIPHRNRRRCR